MPGEPPHDRRKPKTPHGTAADEAGLLADELLSQAGLLADGVGRLGLRATLKPRVSRYRKAIRAFRQVYQHGHHERELWQDHAFNAQLAAAPEAGQSLPLDRVDATKMPRAEFNAKYAAAGVPVMLTGCCSDELKAKWAPSELVHRFGEQRFVVSGEFTWGEKKLDGRMKLKHYLRYCTDYAKADWPFYLFEEDLLAEGMQQLHEDYAAPPYFKHDALLVPRCKRPGLRYFLVGGARTGSSVHQDPCETSAWNTLVAGRKRWVLFPPEVPKELMCPVIPEGVTDCNAYWWAWHLPQLRPHAETLGLREVVQEAGETIFVPRGWWHAVINIEMTVAITENVVPPAMFPATLAAMVDTRPRYAQAWVGCLRARAENKDDPAAVLAQELVAVAADFPGLAAAGEAVPEDLRPDEKFDAEGWECSDPAVFLAKAVK